jgi:hypothetical protein
MALLGGRAMLVTQTNEQAFDLARRCARDFPQQPFTLFPRSSLTIPDDVGELPNVQIARKAAELPHGPCVVIANATKWSWLDETWTGSLSCQVVDEAFQLSDYRFCQIANLAERVVLIGDPGQIAPVVTCAIERWRTDPAGPHVACPDALHVRHPDVVTVGLPVSRRLVTDTVGLVQPAFYPYLPFTALCAAGERRLGVDAGGDETSAVDRAIDLAAEGASLIQVELPPETPGVVDEGVVDAIVSLVESLFARHATIDEGNQQRVLTPDRAGIVCTHVAQVGAVRERLPHQYGAMLVETADRYQGLERDVMIAYHPLSGRMAADAFHLDAGRICVMTSRHRVVCYLVTRSGLNALLQQMPDEDRTLGRVQDREFTAWQAHVSLLEALARNERIVR